MGKNILEKLFAEYDQNIDRILKRCDGKYGIDEIVGAFMSLPCKESLGSGLKQ